MGKRTGEINPKEYSLTLGTHEVKGFYTGTIISIVRDANNYSYLMGADEEMARMNLNNLVTLFTIILHQTSDSNDVLSLISNLDRKTGKGAFPLLFKDGWGRSAGGAPVTWIEKDADQPFEGGADATPPGRTWPIRCAHYEGIIGGNRTTATA